MYTWAGSEPMKRRPTLMNRIARAGRAFFAGTSGYDAVDSRGKRKAPPARTRSEDQELLLMQRRMLLSGTRDLQRNFAIAAWAIRKHLDYVSTFAFQSRTGIGDLDDKIETLMK